MSTILPLNDGNLMPRVGSISFRHDSPQDTSKIISNLLNIGIRHFEISELYENGHIIMDTISKQNIPRSEVYITWKTWAKGATPIELIENFKISIQAAGLNYVDLLILHDPVDSDAYIELWRSLEVLKEENFTKSIGVSKITVTLLLELIRKSTIPPAVFQTEISPYNISRELIDYCEDNGVVISSLELFSKGLRSKDSIINDLADEIGMSREELIMSWAITKNFALVLPPTLVSLPNYLNGTIDSLKDEEMAVLDNNIEEHLDTLWIPSVARNQEE